jgi:hypothetical protein
LPKRRGEVFCPAFIAGCREGRNVHGRPFWKCALSAADGETDPATRGKRRKNSPCVLYAAPQQGSNGRVRL